MISIVSFIAVMTIIVAVHEFGHFIVARWCGIRVDVFSIGFGREIVGFTDTRSTRWRLCWLPLGGYVKFYEPPATPRLPDEATGATSAPHVVAFRDKPIFQRAAVLVAGPCANFLLAIAIYAALYMIVGAADVVPRIGSIVANSAAAKAGLKAGDSIIAIDGKLVHSHDEIGRIVGTSPGRPLNFAIDRDGDRLTFAVVPEAASGEADPSTTIRWGDVGIRRGEPAVVGAVAPDTPAERAGLKAADRIVAIDGRAIASYDDLVHVVATNPGRTLAMRIVRGDTSLPIGVTPSLIRQTDDAGNVVFRGRIGISCALPRRGPITAVAMAVETLATSVGSTVAEVWQGVTKKGASVEVGGPIAMAKITGDVADLGFIPLIQWTALLSLSIGAMNLLPIPVLDGGRLALCGLEALRRRPLDRSIENAAFRVGLAFMVVLFVYANVTDLVGLGRAWLVPAG